MRLLTAGFAVRLCAKAIVTTFFLHFFVSSRPRYLPSLPLPLPLPQTFLEFLVALWNIGTMAPHQWSEMLWDVCECERVTARAHCLNIACLRETLEEVSEPL